MKLFDLAVKVEYLMMELMGNMMWGSIMEIGIFLVLVLLFVEDSQEMGAIWPFFPHVIRAVVGVLILNGLPRTHDIIKTASFPEDQRMDVDMIFELLTRAAKDALDHFTLNTKRLLHAYFGLTTLCFIIDMFSFLVFFNRFGNHVESAYADISLLLSSTTLFVLDIYYIAWVLSLEKRVPPYISNNITKAAFGGLDSMYTELGDKIAQQRAKRQQKVENSRKDF